MNSGTYFNVWMVGMSRAKLPGYPFFFSMRKNLRLAQNGHCLFIVNNCNGGLAWNSRCKRSLSSLKYIGHGTFGHTNFCSQTFQGYFAKKINIKSIPSILALSTLVTGKTMGTDWLIVAFLSNRQLKCRHWRYWSSRMNPFNGLAHPSLKT